MSHGTSAVRPKAARSGRQLEHRPAGSGFKNVGSGERLISIAAGGGLMYSGLKRGGVGGLLLALAGGDLLYRGATGWCSLYQALGINRAVSHNPAIGVRAGRGIKIEKSIGINRPPQELHRFLRNIENLPQVMDHLLEVHAIDEKRSHWVAVGPWGTTLQWDAEIIGDRDGELIAWRSLPGGDVETAGSVHFRLDPTGHGTVVQLSLKYDPPGGKIAANLAEFLGRGLDNELEEDLRHFKQQMEAGEVPTIEGQPSGGR